jgi:hypothetical protein
MSTSMHTAEHHGSFTLTLDFSVFKLQRSHIYVCMYLEQACIAEKPGIYVCMYFDKACIAEKPAS